eukprot:GFUD01027759.1.p1 GENE.GFUD01027759.1~~GFUD01027759.1.p1  ORF type:complete len:344 (-),score=99.86 GFUD01027759.1:75-1106(-)
MATPKKSSHLTASPLVRSPRHNQPRTSLLTPDSKRGKQSSKPCDRSQDLYKRICQGLLDNTRTPPKNKVLTPTKFFKSRAAAPTHVVRDVFIYFCDEPVEYIKDLKRLEMQKCRGRSRSRKSRSAAVEMVMPLYNIKTVDGAQEHIEIVADIVEEVFEQSTIMKVKERRSQRNATPAKTPKRTKNLVIRSEYRQKVEKSSDNKPQIYSFVEDPDNVIEDEETSAKKSIKVKVKKVATAGPSKRKGTLQANSRPSKKRKTFVYNNLDSSDEDDNIFISTVKPIISEEEKREMKQILGNAETEKLLGDESTSGTVDEDGVVEGEQKQDIASVESFCKEVELEESL